MTGNYDRRQWRSTGLELWSWQVFWYAHGMMRMRCGSGYNQEEQRIAAIEARHELIEQANSESNDD